MGVSWLGREPRTAALPGPTELRPGLGETTAPAYAGSSSTLNAEQRAMIQYAKQDGLARLSVSIVADTGSRVRLLPGVFNPKNGQWENSDDPFLHELIMRLKGRYTDQQQTLWQHLWHRRVTGERYQVREFDPAENEVYFSVYGPTAVEQVGNGRSYRIKDTEGDKGRLVAAQDVTRMWWPDPNWPRQPWSPLWAGLSDLRRFHLLGKVISRTAASSLIARGMIWVPKEGLGREIVHRGKKKRQLFADYYDASHDTLIAADDSVAATVPYLISYGNDFKEPQLIKFGIPFDNQLIPLRSEALESYARSADMPSALLINGGPGGGQTGSGQRFNHISDLLVDRRYFDHTVAPQLDAVLHWDLTRYFFRPALIAARDAGAWKGDPDMVRISYDASPVIIPADKSKSALVAFRSGLLSTKAALEALGFNEADAPSPGELQKIIALMVAMNQGIRAGDQNQTPDGQPRGEVSANGQGTKVSTSA